MTIPKNVLNVAKIFIDLEEVGDNCNPFGRWYNMNGEPWCAMFVSFCTYVTGMPLEITTLKGFAYCPYGVNWFKEKGWWQKDDPKPGDIVFYDFGEGVAHHTGIVDVVEDDYIYTIEGNTSQANQSNGRYVQHRKRERNSTIVGYGRPPYDGKDIGVLAKDVPPFASKEISLSSTLPSSQDVLLWKKQMQDRGWTVAEPNDAAFTEQDEKLLKLFQHLWDIEADGILGSMSWLLTWLEPTQIMREMRLKDYGEDVYKVQEALVKAKINVTVDGEFGPKTKSAVEQFQKQNDLTPDGIVGKKTLSKLGLNFSFEERQTAQVK